MGPKANQPSSTSYIEVKTFTEVRPGEYRFFLSENEAKVSRSPPFEAEYYFYLVMFDSDGNRSSKTVKMRGESPRL
ncbi:MULTISPECIES: protein NO VEIN domain-containing protein [Hydrogenophaga]|uniref:protein NO VEIN domain-containing protein n=1 Tax=Hydrogenophaga TaxID=47420 RepID=UPI00110EFAEA|nr:DUF3883 domain-containing protein [Hydrogenophaga intermedia]